MKTFVTTLALAAAISSPSLAQNISFSGLAGSKTVDTNGSVSMDGASVTVRGRIGENLEMNGASVDVYADVGGDAELNGAGIEMVGSVMGRLEINGASIRVEGNYYGPVVLAGANLRLDGTFIGPVTAEGGDLRLSGQFAEPVEFRGVDRDGFFRRGNQSHVRIDADLASGGVICAREVSFSSDSRVGDVLTIIASSEPEIPEGMDRNLVEFQERNGRSCENWSR